MAGRSQGTSETVPHQADEADFHAKGLCMTAVRRALEAAGVMFIDDDGTAGPGVRLRKPQRKRA